MEFIWEHQILVEITQLHRVFECQENTLVACSQGSPHLILTLNHDIELSLESEVEAHPTIN
jgi:hypothetical protein